MRKLIASLAIGLLFTAGGLGVSVKSVSAAGAQAKVVIVVGATQGTTASYRANGDSAAATFAQYTNNIIKVYSPNATWAAVQSAAQGAAVLVYIGHGSGYPNPYVSYLQPNGDNGMGLNATAGAGDSNTKYYGENYMAQLGLAPNAVVILWHLCYASGDNEPGYGAPSASVAQTRIDGYASGFLRGNARAVIAEGVGSISSYINAIFSTHQTIDQVWKSAPNYHHNVTSWPSTRNAGYTSQMDPDYAHPQSDGDPYYRSMVSQPGLDTDIVGIEAPPFVSRAGTYVPVTPVRVVDTRPGTVGPVGAINGGGVSEYQIAGKGGIPAGAVAVTANLTVTGQTGSGWAYLSPSGAAPTSSTLNFPVGDDRATGTTVPLSPSGTLFLFFGGASGQATANFVIDVTGYFRSDDAGATYHSLNPARILDTRSNTGLSGSFSAGVPRTFQVTGHGGVPSNATAVAGNLTVVNVTTGGAVYLGPVSTASPSSSTINFRAGDVRANGVIVALGSGGTLSATYLAISGTTSLIFDVSGYFTTDTSGATYHPLAPARLLDTRAGNGLSGPFSVGVPRTFQVAGRGGIPASATAVTGNLTVADVAAGGAVYLGPVATASPSTSTINFGAGDVIANGVTVALAGDGSLSATYLAEWGTTSLIFDVSGYFTPDSTSTSYHTIDPLRFLDTRSGNGLSGSFSAGVPRTFQVTGRGNVPASAIAVTGNLTVTDVTTAGAVYLGPDYTATPSTSTLNFRAGDAVANGVTVALAGDGSLSATYLASSGTLSLIFDVSGFFTPDTSGATYHSLTPARVLDTRSGVGLSGAFNAKEPRTFQVTGSGGVPANASAITGNLTLANVVTGGALYLGPDSTASPASSTINFAAGDVIANGVTVVLGSGGTLSATYMAISGTTNVILDVTGYFTPDATGSAYHALIPARILDTRANNGLNGKFSAGTPRTFQVTGRNGIPSNAIAVTGNLTVADVSSSWALYLGPNSTANPSCSTINFSAGDIRANGVTVALGSGGTLSATYLSMPGNTTSLIFDVTGYFAP